MTDSYTTESREVDTTFLLRRSFCKSGRTGLCSTGLQPHELLQFEYKMYFTYMAILNIRDIGMFISRVLFKAKQVLINTPRSGKKQSLTTATSMTKIIQVSDMYCNTSLNDFISKRMQGQSGSFGYKERGNQVWFLFFWKSPLVFHMVYVANRHTCKVPEIWQIYLRKKVGGYGYGSELICRFVEGFMETLFTPLTF